MNRIFLMHIGQFRKKIMLINKNLSGSYEARDRLIKFIRQDIHSLNLALGTILAKQEIKKQKEKVLCYMC
jgi:hypothetical protein